MSRKKLQQLGISLPVLPTTSVGSFPKPDFLVAARAEFAKKKITREELSLSGKPMGFPIVVGISSHIFLGIVT